MIDQFNNSDPKEMSAKSAAIQKPNHQIEQVSAERVRQVQGICWLLDREVDELRGQPTDSRRPIQFVPNALMTALSGSVLLLIGLASFVWHVWSIQPLQQIPDYRWGTNYDEQPATDLLVQGNIVHLATQGTGVHSFDISTKYFKQLTSEGSDRGLLSNDVLQIQVDRSNQLYFLCQSESQRGLCRSSDRSTDWQTLFGFGTFPELTTDYANQITDILSVEDELWFATKDSGIGVYAPKTRQWTKVYRQEPEALLSNEVWDLARGDAGEIWIATSTGMNRFDQDRWNQFTVKDGLLGDDIRELAFHEEELWYRTASGGVGKRVEDQWQTVWSESGWGEHTEDQLVSIAASDGSSQIWWLDNQGELAAYDQNTAEWQIYKPLSDEGTESHLAVQNNGKSGDVVWLGTATGLHQFRPQSAGKSQQQVYFPGQKIASIESAVDALSAAVYISADKPEVEVRTKSSEGDFVKRLGTQTALGPSPEFTEIVADTSRNVFWFASQTGIAPYDTSGHDWTITGLTSDRLLVHSGVVSLDTVGANLTFLTGDRQVKRWAPGGQQVPVDILGTGSFPGEEEDISAVVKDPSGNLWIGTKTHGLHLYSPRTRSWTRTKLNIKSVKSLAASITDIWILADDALYVSKDGSPHEIEKLQLGEPRILSFFAHPKIETVVLLDEEGNVRNVDNKGVSTTVVGSAAMFQGTDVQAVGMFSGLVLVATKENWVYDLQKRSWRKLKSSKSIRKIVAGSDRLWLLSVEGEILTFAGDDIQRFNFQTPGLVRDIAFVDSQLYLLEETGRLQSFDSTTSQASTLLGIASGPTSEEVQPQSRFSLLGDDLFLNSTPQGQLWKFSWADQAWTLVRSQNGPIQSIQQLVATETEVLGLNQAGEVFAVTADQEQARKLELPPVQSLNVSLNRIVRTDQSGEVYQSKNGVWAAIWTQLRSGIKEAQIITAVSPRSDGLLISTDQGTALLNHDLDTWQGATSQKSFVEIMTDASGEKSWGREADGQLAYYDASKHHWVPVVVPGASEFQNLSIGNHGSTATLSAVTNNGQVFHIVDAKAMSTWSPTTSTQPLTNAVSVVPVDDGYVWCFPRGEASLFTTKTKTWSPVKLPGDVQHCLDWNSELGSQIVLLDAQGKVHIAPARHPFPWKTIASDIAQISTYQSQLITLSESNREILAWSSEFKNRAILQGLSAPDKEDLPVAVAELQANKADSSLLIVAGRKQTSIYDPQFRTWTQQPLQIREFQKSPEALYALSNENQLIRIDRQDRSVNFRLLPVPSVSKIRASNNFVYLMLSDGRIGVLNKEERFESITGLQLPSSLAEEKIHSLSSDSKHLYLSTASRAVYRYDWSRREWSHTPILKNAMAWSPTEQGGWLVHPEETRTVLSHVNLSESPVLTTKLVQDLRAWNPSTGVEYSIVESVQDAIRYRKIDPSGEAQFEQVFEPGPLSEHVTSWSQSRQAIVMQTKDQQLHLYDLKSRKWISDSVAQDVIDYELSGSKLLFRNSKRDLFLAQLNLAATGWDFSKIGEDCVGYDSSRERIIWSNPKQIHLLEIQESDSALKQLAVRKITSEMFPEFDANNDFKDLLLTATQVFVVSSRKIYQLDENLQEEVIPLEFVALRTGKHGESLLVETSAGVFRREGREWKLETTTFPELLTSPALKNLNQGSSFQIEYPFDETTSLATDYTGRHFELFSEIRGQSDLFAMTDSGLYIVHKNDVVVVRSDRLSLLTLEHHVERFLWGKSESDSPILYAVNGETASRIDRLTAVVDSNWESAVARASSIAMNEESWNVVVSAEKSTAQLVSSSSGESRGFNLAAGGFLDDQIIDFDRVNDQLVVLTSAGLALISPNGFRRLLATSHVQIDYTNGTLVTSGNELFLTVGGSYYQIAEGQIRLVENPKLSHSHLTFQGKAWSTIPGSENSFEVTYFGERTQQTRFIAGKGLLWDTPHSMVRTDTGLLVSFADGQSRYQNFAAIKPSIDRWSEVTGGRSNWEQSVLTSQGELWGRSGDEWFLFQPAELKWSEPIKPAVEVLQELQMIAKHGRSQWRSSGDKFELNEALLDKSESILRFNAAGLSEDWIPLANIPVPDGNWVISKTSFLKLNHQGETALHQKMPTPIRSAAINQFQGRWFLSTKLEKEVIYWALRGDEWQLVSRSDTPFAPATIRELNNQLRVVETEGTLTVQIRANDQQPWLPVRWNSHLGCFDFQAISQAIDFDPEILAETNLGIAIWKRNRTRYQLTELWSDLRQLQVLGDGTILAENERQQRYQFQTSTGWKPDGQERTTSLIKSKRWQIEQSLKQPEISVLDRNQNPIRLNLDSRGGFVHQYANQLNVLENRSVFLEGDLAVSQFQRVGESSQLELTGFWKIQPDPQIVDGLELLNLKTQSILWMDSTAYVLRDANWSLAPNQAELQAIREQFWNDSAWVWSRNVNQQFVGQHSIDQQQHVFEYDSAHGRFTRDRVRGVAILPESICLNTEDRVEAISRKTPFRSIEIFASQQGAQFKLLPESTQLILHVPGNPASSLQLSVDEMQNPHIRPLTESEIPALTLGTLYADRDWTFKATEISWGGQPANLVDGEFIHDQFQQLLHSNQQRYLSTPAGIQQFRESDLGEWSWELTIPHPLPPHQKTVYSIENNLLTLHRANAEDLAWAPEQSKWISATSSHEEQTLTQINGWDVTRTAGGEFVLRWNQADKYYPLKAILSERGRFKFDEMEHQALHQSSLWLGGTGGICQRDLSDGRILNWWVSGIDKSGNQVPFDGIVRIAALTPVLPDAEQRTRGLFAESQSGDFWMFDESQQHWVRFEENPWLTEVGELISETPLFDLRRTATGEKRLSTRNFLANSAPHLQAGRLAQDITHSLVIHKDAVWRATPVGVIQSSVSKPYLGLTHLIERPGIHSVETVSSLSLEHSGGDLIAVLETGAVAHFSMANHGFQAPFFPNAEQIENCCVVYQNPFWKWSRWQHQMRVKFLGLKDVSTPENLVREGRWSFDIVDQIQIVDDSLWAQTPVGMLAYDLNNNQIKAWKPTARDSETFEETSFDPTLRFTNDKTLKAVSPNWSYELQQGEWIRSVKSTSERSLSLALPSGWSWQIVGLHPDGLSLRLLNQRDNLVGPQEILSQHNFDELVAARVDGQRLWLAFEHGLYVLTPKTRIPEN